MRLINKTKIITCVATIILMSTGLMNCGVKTFKNNTNRPVKVTLQEGCEDERSGNKFPCGVPREVDLKTGETKTISYAGYVYNIVITFPKIVMAFPQTTTTGSLTLPEAKIELLFNVDGINSYNTFLINGTEKSKIVKQ